MFKKIKTAVQIEARLAQDDARVHQRLRNGGTVLEGHIDDVREGRPLTEISDTRDYSYESRTFRTIMRQKNG